MILIVYLYIYIHIYIYICTYTFIQAPLVDFDCEFRLPEEVGPASIGAKANHEATAK